MANFNKSEEFEYIFKNLGKSDNKVEKLFDSMKDVYMVAFLLGAIRDEKTPIKKRSQDPIKDVYFSQDDKALMDLIKKYENIPTPQKANIADLLFEINSKLQILNPPILKKSLDIGGFNVYKLSKLFINIFLFKLSLMKLLV